MWYWFSSKIIGNPIHSKRQSEWGVRGHAKE